MDAAKFSDDLANIFGEKKPYVPDNRELEFREFWNKPMYSERKQGPQYSFVANMNAAGYVSELRETMQRDDALTAGKVLEKYHESHPANPMSDKQFFHFLYSLAAFTEKPWRGKTLRLFECGKYK